jgi:hypothetical protein
MALLRLRLAVIVATTGTVAWLAAPPSFASVQPGDPYTGCHPCTGFLQDGNGVGDAASPVPKIQNPDNTALFAIPVNGGAWRWDLYELGQVSSGTFNDTGLATATAKDYEYAFVLHAKTVDCMSNVNGGAYSGRPCTYAARQTWVYDPDTGYWINVGRSNDEGTTEILCNSGGGGSIIITTPDGCSDYHEEWAFNKG